MIRNDLDVLHCDIRMLVMRLLELFQLFGASNSVSQMGLAWTVSSKISGR